MVTKTFESLRFEEYVPYNPATRAVMDLDDGYSIIVLLGKDFCSNGLDTYEVAILYDRKLWFDIP